MKSSDVYAVILAGGQSSRLFPFNKVLSDLTGSGRSLIQQAFARVSLLSRKNIYVLTVRAMVPAMRKQIKLPADHFLTDPARRGTWPALLWAMAHLRRANPNAVMAVVTGDHVIPKTAEFQRAFRQAVHSAREQSTFVIIPVQPSENPKEWVSFGAVQRKIEGKESYPIQDFEEKPSLDRAARMIKEGGWFWNAGMFFFRIAVAEEVLHVYQPDMCRIYLAMADALAKNKKRRAAEIFESFPEKIRHPFDAKRLVDNTIDYAVIMPLVHRSHPVASARATRQSLAAWADLGHWTALRQLVKPDRQQNVKVGRVDCSPGTHDCILAADKGYSMEVDGLQNFVVAFSGREVLVLPEHEVPLIKERVSEAKEAGRGLVCIGLPQECVQIHGRHLVVRAKRGFIP